MITTLLKQCEVCGQFYKPDSRVGKRQRVCKKEACKKERKTNAHNAWLLKNPDAYTGRYPKLQAWRQAHPDYQRKWRARRRVEIQDEIAHSEPSTIRVCAITVKRPITEIQDEIVLTPFDIPRADWVRLVGAG